MATIYSEAFEKEFQMLQIDCLEVRKAESYILSAIPFNKGTINSNYKVYKSIFLQQLGRN